MFDIAHPAGLVAGGAHPNPVALADVVTLTTHKTLRGPRGGAILCRSELAKAIDSAVFPGLQGGPLEHVIAAKAVAFREAAQPSFRLYASAVVSNARALGVALADEGFRLVSGGTDNHLLLVDLRPFDEELTGKEAQEVLDRSGITLNRNTIPDDPRSAFVTSGLRLGTAAQTTAGMGEAEMGEIGALIGVCLRDRTDGDVLESVRRSVRALCDRFPPYPGLTGPEAGPGDAAGGRGD
ncbi:MAG TPA: serine hydroxymethyltransferase, partial [Acidimicrobiales bacterium]